ncbi:hypothetical protein [Vreelandella titanicae]
MLFQKVWSVGPFAEGECHVLLIELRGVVNTGDFGSELQTENDVSV